MLFSVPQYIDIEDKIAGPLTARQLGWMFGLGAILFVIWSMFPQTVFIAIAIPMILLFIALAFYRPQGISLLSFLSFGVGFLFRPKLYMWKRLSKHEQSRTASRKDKHSVGASKKRSPMSIDDMVALARTLDSEGMHQSDRAAELIAKHIPQGKK